MRALALIANGLAVVLFLFTGLLSLVADVGTSTALEGLFWSVAAAVAALIVVFFIFRPTTRFTLLLILPYSATCFFWIASGIAWIERFNISSKILPPPEAILFGGLGLIDLLAVAAASPIPLRTLIRERSSRWIVGSLTALAFTIAGVATYRFIDRVATQYPYAERFLARGGSLHWENGWITGIYAKETEVTDDDLIYAQQFPKLQSLYLSDTQVTDAGLAHISGIKSLEHLYLNNTKVTDQGLRHITQLASLRNLWICGTQVTDSGLAYLEPMTQMGYLELGRTKVSDAGLRHLRGMTRLYYFGSSNTGVTDEGLQELARSIPGLSAWNGHIHISR